MKFTLRWARTFKVSPSVCLGRTPKTDADFESKCRVPQMVNAFLSHRITARNFTDYFAANGLKCIKTWDQPNLLIIMINSCEACPSLIIASEMQVEFTGSVNYSYACDHVGLLSPLSNISYCWILKACMTACCAIDMIPMAT